MKDGLRTNCKTYFMEHPKKKAMDRGDNKTERSLSQLEPRTIGRYAVIKPLGEGGKRKIYRAHDPVFARDVALAVPKKKQHTQEFKKQILHEARIAGRLGAHENIVAVYDIGEHENQPFIAMELMAAGNLTDAMARAAESQLPLDHVVKIAITVCKVLQHVHRRGIVHGNLKASNVYFEEDATAKIGDFRLSVLSL